MALQFEVNLSILFTELPLLEPLKDGGYEGRVGCEYKPEGPSAESFEWLPGASIPASRGETH